MKLGILEADTISKQYIETFSGYPKMFDGLLKMSGSEIELVTYDVRAGQYPNHIDYVDAYLITGSEAGVYDNLPWFLDLADFIKQLHTARKKLIGICFGHQFIAHTLGGHAEKSSKGWGIGRHPVQVNDGDYQGVSEFSLVFCHQDQVITPATGAKVIAGNEFCPNAMCTIGDHILTFQAHPEFTKEFTLKLLDVERSKYGEELYAQAMNSLDTPLDQKLVSSWLTDFLKA